MMRIATRGEIPWYCKTLDAITKFLDYHGMVWVADMTDELSYRLFRWRRDR
jgi:hypothetical protein